MRGLQIIEFPSSAHLDAARRQQRYVSIHMLRDGAVKRVAPQSIDQKQALRGIGRLRYAYHGGYGSCTKATLSRPANLAVCMVAVFFIWVEDGRHRNDRANLGSLRISSGR